jgi:hypothetical protein
MGGFAQLFVDPQRIDAVFFKVIAPNDDSGRHGIVVPKSAYGMFPDFDDFDPDAKKNYTEKIKTIWCDEAQVVERKSCWKHYHRYPERRMTALRSRKLNAKPPLSLMVVGRRGRASRTYECRVIYPDESAYGTVLAEFGFKPKEVKECLYGLILPWTPKKVHARTPALIEFLSRFDKIAAKGLVPTMRNGDTGVGYTFETLMGIAENNQRCGDFMGMEIKTYRSEELKMRDAEKMNLFLREPKWVDGLSAVDRVLTCGYRDENGRCALYSTVQMRMNAHGFAFRIDKDAGRLWLQWNARDVAYWRFADLETRLREKLDEAVYIAAQAVGRGAGERFFYRTVTHCQSPSVEAFVSLLEQGDAMLEIRMHIEDNGRHRNHGCGFRIKKNRIQMLYGSTVQYRELPPIRANASR